MARWAVGMAINRARWAVGMAAHTSMQTCMHPCLCIYTCLCTRLCTRLCMCVCASRYTCLHTRPYAGELYGDVRGSRITSPNILVYTHADTDADEHVYERMSVHVQPMVHRPAHAPATVSITVEHADAMMLLLHPYVKVASSLPSASPLTLRARAP